MRVVINLGKVLVGLAALVALLHFACWNSEHPAVRFVQLRGNSMRPTLLPGDTLLFVQQRWKRGSIVLADVGEAAPVVNRISDSADGLVSLCGDNKRTSQDYWVAPGQIQCVMLCRVPLPLPRSAASASQEPESIGERGRAGGSGRRSVRHRFAATHKPHTPHGSIPRESSGH